MTSKNRLKAVGKSTGGVGRKRLIGIERQPNGQPRRRTDGSPKYQPPVEDLRCDLREWLKPEDDSTFVPHISDPLSHFRRRSLSGPQYVGAIKYRVVGRLLRSLQEAQGTSPDTIGRLQPYGTLRALQGAEGLTEPEVTKWFREARASIRSPVSRGVAMNICINMAPMFTMGSTISEAQAYWDLYLKHNEAAIQDATNALARFFKVDGDARPATWVSTTPVSESEKHWSNCA
jgi:hypothetical protein